jgi:hypothetical protein
MLLVGTASHAQNTKHCCVTQGHGIQGRLSIGKDLSCWGPKVGVPWYVTLWHLLGERLLKIASVRISEAISITLSEC